MGCHAGTRTSPADLETSDKEGHENLEFAGTEQAHCSDAHRHMPQGDENEKEALGNSYDGTGENTLDYECRSDSGLPRRHVHSDHHEI